MKLEIIIPGYLNKSVIPLALEAIPAGFPSPAEDYLEERLNISDYIIKNPSSTFYVRVTGTSMMNAGISSGDLLVVDRSIRP